MDRDDFDGEESDDGSTCLFCGGAYVDCLCDEFNTDFEEELEDL